ncbi:hypothetical protein [Cellulomonas phragmiteti]|uniref:Flp pilus-assembly TadG-like N-terminal domain-containing protein n=1 Tax=Cellulomonas phragmiteti TaxID=478780 RepID=A0ABQ4DI99_9CELL|nr:hypothetical protein [Cellulomonas phragmiteti]GIG39078.1 hypothetical protein Cph01nite_08400 [Cellulomonas phragmiteti]
MSWTSPAPRGRRVDGRAVALFVVLDLVTFALLYWLLLPAFAAFLAAIEPTTALAIGWVLSAVRLTCVGVVVLRSYRDRRGLEERRDALPTILVAAGGAWLLQLLLGVLGAAVLGESIWSWQVLLDLATWVGFPLLALLFVSPGEAQVLPPRFRRSLAGDRGATNLLIVPAVAGLLAVALLVIGIAGSATSDSRESRTAADAAALAAADVWRDGVRGAFDAARWAGDPDDFWRFAGTDLGSLTSGAMIDSARAYAAANGAELVDVDVDAYRAQVTVRVRNHETVPQTSRRIESVATAELRLESGVCRSGRFLGFRVGSTCRTAAPAPTPTPSPTPEPVEDPEAPPPPPPPPPPPFAPPSGIGAFLVDTRLVVRG